jgi:PIN domain nuclease of toxin-antitoxin system
MAAKNVNGSNATSGRPATKRASLRNTKSGAVGRATAKDIALLLDTHVWVWLLAGDTTQLADNISVSIENAGVHGRCYVSDISAWEVATKSARQALSLTMEAGAWLDEAAQAPGLNGVAVSREVLVASARLPLNELPDFVDRVLVATALRFGLTVVTADQDLLAFAKAWPLFSVLDARRNTQ